MAKGDLKGAKAVVETLSEKEREPLQDWIKRPRRRSAFRILRIHLGSACLPFLELKISRTGGL